DTRAVYRPLLRFTRPADVLGRGLTVLRQYVNFGNLTVEILERQHGVVTVHGWPAMGAPYFRAYSWPFLERLLTMAGAKHATLEFGEDAPDGALRGVALVKMQGSARWK